MYKLTISRKGVRMRNCNECGCFFQKDDPIFECAACGKLLCGHSDCKRDHIERTHGINFITQDTE